MSVSSKRGADFEREIAAIIRKKTKMLAVRDKKSGALWNRRSDVFTDLPIHIEAKDQETIKVKEWFRQADAAASYAELATLVFRADEFILATVEFHKLIDLFVELADLRAQVEDLRQPVTGLDPFPKPNTSPSTDWKDAVEKVVDKKKSSSAKLCRAGHLSDDWGYCMQLNCKYSRGYKAPKKKK